MKRPDAIGALEGSAMATLMFEKAGVGMTCQSQLALSQFGKTIGLELLLYQARARGSTQIYLHCGMYPLLRERGTLCALTSNFDVLTPSVIENWIAPVMPADARAEFERRLETEFSLRSSDVCASVYVAQALSGWSVIITLTDTHG